MDEIVISTTLLSWNRADLLQRTLQSYIRTVSAPYELFIVDNASNDGSRELISQFCREHAQATPILLDVNEGGEAINHGLARSRGTLLHVSENDIEYLPGWAQFALEDFNAFPELGQLSVFGPVPTDAEAWVVKPSSMRHRHGCVIYFTEHNVGTSSILRRTVWEEGVRVHNYATREGSFKFPDDGRLSHDVQSLGLWSAWAHKYMVRNLGHMGDEIESRPEYYLENYRSKGWLGIEGLRDRMAKWRSQARPIRKSFLYGEEMLSGEKSLPSPECPLPQQWSMIDGNTAEVETLEFLYSVARLVKPQLIVETGTWHGHAAVAFGRALRQNGFGRVLTFEIDSQLCEIAKRQVKSADLSQIVEIKNQSSMQGVPGEQIGILLLDSELSLRVSEFEHFRRCLKDGAIVIFHDTSTIHQIVRRDVSKLIADGLLTGVMFPTPRGLAICQYRGPCQPGVDS
ncbi:MAG TPA: class I SAM-dependent methyltransferase [Bryobacteraceae bacterium]